MQTITFLIVIVCWGLKKKRQTKQCFKYLRFLGITQTQAKKEDHNDGQEDVPPSTWKEGI